MAVRGRPDHGSRPPGILSTTTIDSVYLDESPRNPALALWLRRALVHVDYDREEVLGDRAVRRLLEHDLVAALDRGERDAAIERLAERIPREPDHVFDESDPYCVATRTLFAPFGPSEAELLFLRFGEFAARCQALERVFEGANVGSRHRAAAKLVSRVLGLDQTAVRKLCDTEGRLREIGLLQRLERGEYASFERWFQLVPELQAHVEDSLAGETDPGGLPIVERAPAARFSLADWGHLAVRTRRLERYLTASLDARARGANVLLWGAPGTGKTEMALALAAAANAEGLSVRAIGRNGRELGSSARLREFRLCASIAASLPRALVLFDEVESVLGADDAMKNATPEHRLEKSFVNASLESSVAPSIWIANSVVGIDPAYLRRFDLVLEVPPPPPGVRRAMLERAVGELDLDACLFDAMLAAGSVTPADIAKVRRVVDRIAPADAPALDATVRSVIASELGSRGERPLPLAHASRLGPADGTLANPDHDVSVLVDRRVRTGTDAATEPGTRLALIGPRGSGKSVWLRRIAMRSGIALLRRDYSRLFDEPYESPQAQLRGWFAHATERRAILHVERLEGLFDPQPDLLHDDRLRRAALALIDEADAHEGYVVLESREPLEDAGLLPWWLDDRVRFGPIEPTLLARMLERLLHPDADAPGRPTPRAGHDELALALSGAQESFIAFPGSRPGTFELFAGDLVMLERRLERGSLEREPEALLEACRQLHAARRRRTGGSMGFAPDRR